jgi:hypothetical protein
MDKMLHASKLNILVEQKDSKGMLVPFSLTFRKKNGVLVKASNVVCTSFYSNGRTLNIKYLDSGEIRKVRRVLIFKFNNYRIYQ